MVILCLFLDGSAWRGLLLNVQVVQNQIRMDLRIRGQGRRFLRQSAKESRLDEGRLITFAFHDAVLGVGPRSVHTERGENYGASITSACARGSQGQVLKSECYSPRLQPSR